MTSCNCGHFEALNAAVSTIDALEQQIARMSTQLAGATADLEELRTKSLTISPLGQRSDDGGKMNHGDKALFSNRVVYDGPLLELVTNGTTESEELIRHMRKGASTEETDEVGHTPLMLAALNGRVDLVGTLLHAGAVIDAADFLGKTPLMYAAYAGKAACVSALIAAGASIDARTCDGKTALGLAVEWREPEVVSLLRAVGASV